MGCSSSSAVGVAQRGPKQKFHEVYKLGKKLGEGAFGQVRLARQREKEQEFAVKIVDVRARDYGGEPTKTADHERLSATKQEVEVWELVRPSDHTVELREHYYEKHLYYMVMEKCACSLMDKLSTMHTMLETDLIRIFKEMLMGINHVHKCGIAHRDIKPDNFLFGGMDGSTVKLCDFGLAAKLPKNRKLKGVFGTAPYMSPEMLSSSYDEKTDVWSFGATAYLIIHGDFPYTPKQATAKAMKDVIVAGKPAIRFDRTMDDDQFFSPAFVDRSTPFLQALLQRSPTSRKTAEQALEDSFLRPTCTAETEIICQSEAQEEAPLAPTFRKARKATQNLKELRANPIVQTTLDDLLTKLEGLNNGADVGPNYFSEVDEKEEERQSERILHEKSDDRIHSRSKKRYSTHSGVLSGSSLDLKAMQSVDNIPEDTGDSTTTGGGEDSSGRSGEERRMRSHTHPGHPENPGEVYGRSQ